MKFEFKSESTKPFVDWLKSNVSPNKEVLLHMRDNKFFVMSCHGNKSAIKYSEKLFNEVGLTPINKNPEIGKGVMIGLFNVYTFIKYIEYFKDKDYNMSINFDLVNDEVWGNSYAATSIVLKSADDKDAKITCKCAKLNSFIYLTKEKYTSICDDIVKKSRFCTDIEVNGIEKILQLCALDDITNTVAFKYGEGFKIVGETFEYVINTTGSADIQGGINIDKKYIKVIDIDKYKIYIDSNRLLFYNENSSLLIGGITNNG